MRKLRAAALLLALTTSFGGCSTPEEPAEVRFTEVLTVDGGNLTPELRELEEAQELATPAQAAQVLAPLDSKLQEAYDELLAQEPKTVWVKLVSVACLPPLDVAPLLSGATVDFLVRTDPQNVAVDCVRVVPTVAFVGVK